MQLGEVEEGHRRLACHLGQRSALRQEPWPIYIVSAEWEVGPVAGVRGKVAHTTLHNRQHSPGTPLAVFFSSSTHMWHKKPPWTCTSPALPVGPRTSLVAGGTRRLEQTRRLEDSKREAGRPGPMQRPGLGRFRKGMPVYTWHRHGLDVSSRYPASVK